MANRSSGLRNRHRTGRGKYSRARKSRLADYYGKWQAGRRTIDEKIARHIRAVDAEDDAGGE